VLFDALASGVVPIASAEALLAVTGAAAASLPALRASINPLRLIAGRAVVARESPRRRRRGRRHKQKRSDPCAPGRRLAR
jgi:hypothetical protein